jgi:hypothetical protein
VELFQKTLKKKFQEYRMILFLYFYPSESQKLIFKPKIFFDMKKSLLFFISSLLVLPLAFYGQQQQIENPGFENWEDAGTVKDEPVDWSTIKTCDDPGISSVAPVTFERSDSAHGGLYSLKLYNVKAFSVIATGAITDGRFHAEYNLDSSYSFTDTTNDPRWCDPFTARPDSLTGWFKFFPRGTDAAQFKVILHVGECKLPANGTMPNWIGMAAKMTEHGVTYENWTRFSVPFTYFDDRVPQYLLCTINSGDSTNAVDSSYMLVDDLQLIYSSSGISDPQAAETFLTVAPGKLVIDLATEEEYLNQWFYLININGQTVMAKQLENEQVILSEKLPPGVYVALLKSQQKQYVQKVIIR